jgi:hypothetical protein
MIRSLVFSLSALVLSSQLVAQVPLPSASRRNAMMFGAAWYPEQWPESRWDTDLALMEAAHINFVRVGEFAWRFRDSRRSGETRGAIVPSFIEGRRPEPSCAQVAKDAPAQ